MFCSLYSSNILLSTLILNLEIDRLSDEAYKENLVIKKKMNEYFTQRKKRQNIVVIPNSIYSNIIEQLKDQALKIGFLLSKPNKIASVHPFIEENAKAFCGVDYNARINCRGQPLDLVLDLEVQSGLENSSIYFSFMHYRPNIKNCDLSVKLNKQQMKVTFTENPIKGKKFYHKWIYFALSTEYM